MVVDIRNWGRSAKEHHFSVSAARQCQGTGGWNFFCTGGWFHEIVDWASSSVLKAAETLWNLWGLCTCFEVANKIQQALKKQKENVKRATS